MVGINEIKQLSISERILMVEAIWDSIEEEASKVNIPLTKTQEQELEKRIANYEAGNSITYTWEQLKNSLESK